jgi:hypothetical protein
LADGQTLSRTQFVMSKAVDIVNVFVTVFPQKMQ